ncbi:MAG: hypothetical protein ABJD11_10220 [Gemmatimonadota bacterium]
MSLAAAFIIIAAFALWLIRKPARPVSGAAPGEKDIIDHEELEAAEREIRDRGAMVQPDDEIDGDDWGPGAARPRRGR